MLLRSITKHVHDQNWFAVFLDFFIVVVGVFVGLQVANWSVAQSDKAEYARALDRLDVETATNLLALDTLDASTKQTLTTVTHAFDVLQSCTESAENQKIVSEGLISIMGTTGIHLRRNALEDLTTNSRLLAQQSTQERQRFTDMLFYFDLLLEEAKYSENTPLDERMQNNPIIKIGGWMDRHNKYFGADFSFSRRQLALNVPIDEACKNNLLIKSFYTWERWQTVIPMLSQGLRKQLEATQAQKHEYVK